MRRLDDHDQGVTPTDPHRGAGLEDLAHRLYGVGPVVACAVIGYTGDVGRFANRDHFAAYAGVAPIEHSSGGRIAHRLSRAGQSETQQRHPHRGDLPRSAIRAREGRAYFDRKVAEGKTKREALRSLKRQVSNAIFRQLVLDAERGPGGH